MTFLFQFCFHAFFLGGGGVVWTVGYYGRHKALKCKYMSIGFQNFVSLSLLIRYRRIDTALVLPFLPCLLPKFEKPLTL